MIINNVDGLVEIINFRVEVLKLGTLGALPENYRSTLDVLTNYPSMLPGVTVANTNVCLEPEPQQQTAKQMAVVIDCALHP